MTARIKGSLGLGREEMDQQAGITASESQCLDSLANASALLALADTVILNHDVIRLQGEAAIGLSVLIGEAKRLVHLAEHTLRSTPADSS